MSSVRFLSIAFAGLVLIGFSHWHLKPRIVALPPTPKAEAVYKNVTAENGQNHMVRNEIDALQKEIRSLSSRMKTVEYQQLQQSRQMASLQQYSTAFVTAVDASDKHQSNVVEVDETTLAEREQQRFYDYMDYIENSLQNEPIDQRWASDTRKTINQVFTSEEFVGANVVDIECRATLCRVEVIHDSLQAVGDFDIWWPQKLAAILPNATVDRFTLEDGSVGTSIYLAREGYGLPRPQN